MALSSSDSSVTIGNETFSLVEIPQAGTELVKAEKKRLLGELDLEYFVADLGKLGSFIRLAYNGVAGNTELQIKVQRVGYKITKLTEESAVTVHKFKQTARSVLQELQGTYHFLLDGLEEMALENLAALANLAEAMAKAAEELQKKFEAATTDVVYALEDTQRSKGVRENRREELKRQRKERIKNCKNDEGLEEVAIDALHNSIGALKSLSTIMMHAALFWRQMQAHCESLAKKDMQNMIERAMKYPEEKRIKLWTSQGFKSKGVIYYSKWVAHDDVCGAYMEQIKKTREDLYRYLQENPTTEEARRNIRQLAVSFGEELKEAQRRN